MDEFSKNIPINAPLPARAAPEGGAVREKISIRHLNFYYGGVPALTDVNLPLYEKRVTAIIGPSGCGKSTLLRVLNRVYDLYPDQRADGEVLLDGQNILARKQDLNELRERVGMVFQRPTPFPMSIYGNIAFGIGLQEILSDSDMADRVESVLKQTALWDEVKDRLQESAFSLSVGQQQRLCLARTIALKPEIILFDEPCSALDPVSTAKIEELFDHIKHDQTLVIVTHNLQQAARVSDYTAFLHLGRLIEFGDTHRIFTKPRHEQTLAYVTGRFG